MIYYRAGIVRLRWHADYSRRVQHALEMNINWVAPSPMQIFMATAKFDGLRVRRIFLCTPALMIPVRSSFDFRIWPPRDRYA